MRPAWQASFCTPGTGDTLRVQVPRKAGHSDPSEAQLRKGDRPWGGSVERKRGPTNRNRISGGTTWDERARSREVPMTKGWRRKSGGRARKGVVLIRGYLASRPKGRHRLSME